MTVLLREAIGDRLRHARTTQHRSLREVSRAARVSLGYLSEVERGRKEASSELLAAICDALELPLSDLLSYVAADVRAVDEVTAPPVAPSLPAGFAIGGGKPRPQAEPAMQGGRMVPAVVGNDLADLRLQPALSHRLSTSITPPGGVVVAA
ncbi:MAG TPA: helix-turn-helix transcriptional regulator [Pseudonocardiaceae bacterium]|jgi:transcriptional regulator with XRE-family HTH domain|nr:helix-turn-helix transcriptional regulator [Pseudonocardiaceae bacterium]